MKISSKLIITTATGVIGLIAVAIVSYQQITRIHKSTVNFADFIYPSVSTLDGISNDVAQMKAVTLQMIVDEGDDTTFGTLSKQFEIAKADMLGLIKKYRERLVRDETDRALLDSVEVAAKIALENLNLVARVVHKHDITTATEFWYTIDENLELLSSAIKKLKDYNDRFVEKSYIEANNAYDSSLMLSLITSGIVTLLMSGMTIWAYKSLIDPLKTLENKLDEISHSLNLQKRLEINVSDELLLATESINRLLERAHVGMVDMNEKHDKATYVAHHDHLTGLPNRSLFSDRLIQALSIAKRDKTHLAIMFIDLDKFKPVNDVFGHHIGDLLLKEAADRMLECIRESDTVARLGGDEFVVLLPFIETEQDALLVAEKIRHVLNQPFVLVGNQLSISSSTGIVVYPEHGMNEAELTKNADVAMYHVKENGRNAVMLFNTDMRK